MKPVVSICIPTYKQTKYLKKTLDSIKIQNYKDYELIVTDDSPNDSVRKLLGEYDFGGQLKYFKNRIRKGSPENWNTAISYASGEYIKILHHDDWFSDKDSLSEFIDMLDKNPKADFAFSAINVYYEFNKNKNRIHTVSTRELCSLKKEPATLFFGNIIGNPSTTIYRNGLNIKYDYNFEWLVDIDFYIRLLTINKNILYSDNPLVYTSADANHQITNRCINNKEVEIFEYYSLFNKIKNRIPRIKRRAYLLHLWNITIRYKIKVDGDIINCGYRHQIPRFISVLLFLNRIIPLIVKLYTKIDNKLVTLLHK